MTDRPDFGDVLPDTTSDEDDEGWGEPRADDADDADDTDDLRRFLDERPPHHGG